MPTAIALYASYTAAMIKNVFELADRRQTNIEGMLTRAFEFEDHVNYHDDDVSAAEANVRLEIAGVPRT
jgi:hypothetical protein